MNSVNSRSFEFVGLVTEKIIFIHDYVQLVFNDGSILNVYNNWEHCGASPSNLLGTKVKKQHSTEKSFSLHFENGLALTVSLADDDFYGPEAMVLTPADGPIVVWE